MFDCIKLNFVSINRFVKSLEIPLVYDIINLSPFMPILLSVFTTILHISESFPRLLSEIVRALVIYIFTAACFIRIKRAHVSSLMTFLILIIQLLIGIIGINESISEWS